MCDAAARRGPAEVTAVAGIGMEWELGGQQEIGTSSLVFRIYIGGCRLFFLLLQGRGTRMVWCTSGLGLGYADDRGVRQGLS